MNAPTIVQRIADSWCNIFLLYTCAMGVQYAALLYFGFLETLRLVRGVPWQETRRRIQSPMTPAISIVVPAHNEESGITETVRSLLTLNYPKFEVVVVSDGSTDRTLESLIENFDLHRVWRPYVPRIPSQPVRCVYESQRYPNLLVVDKQTAGCKADAANAALNVARHPLVAVIDGDCVLDANSLLRAVRPFVRDPGRTVAVGGTIRIGNGCKFNAGRIVSEATSRALLPRIQTVEYLRAFLFDRMAWSWAGGLLIVSGAFGLFDRRIVIEAGGFSPSSLGEDMELIVGLHHRLRDANVDYRVRFVPDPVCWTEVPERLRDLRGQRMRWHKGLLGVLWRHRAMIGRPRYGAVGMIAMPCFLLFEVLGPLVELSGLVLIPLFWALGVLNTDLALALVLLVGCLGISFSMLAVLLDDIAFHSYPRLRDLAALISAAIMENVGYRQLTAWWRVQASCEFLMRRRGVWGVIERRGPGRA